MIGLDVAKDTLAACYWEKDQPQPTWERTYPNSDAGIRQLLADTSPQEPWVLEPTGPYAQRAVELALEAGRQPRQADPLAAKRYLQSHSARAKTDRVDARGLARFGLDRELPPYRLKEPQLQQLWELLQVRRALTKALATLRQQQQVLTGVRAHTREAIAALGQQVKALDQELQALGRQLELFRRLRQVPGIGLVTAAALTVRLSSGHFPTDDAFVAYVGLDVRVCTSGTFKGRPRLTKHGDAMLRWLLYLAARATRRSKQGRGFRQLYERKLAEGCTTTGAFCIVARKLARLAWSLAHTGQDYDPARVFTPLPRQQA
jgi:transposase